MKFGEYLIENIAPEYGEENYVNYRDLKDLIRALSMQQTISTPLESNRQISLSAPPPTDNRGQPMQQGEKVTPEVFYSALDKEMAKVEAFTLEEVTKLRKQLSAVEKGLKREEDVEDEAGKVGESYLHLEKYVNLNYMGFHKILKTHDRHLPSNPCKAFYLKRLHDQAWVRGDYSDVMVRLSEAFSQMRDDVIVEEKADAAGSFLRSTSKYWVKTEDVTRVKMAVLKHLPVFLQKAMDGESDSQLTNSVYFDNDQLELYHGRLDKTPGAIALRLRWYGTGTPKLVFVERKTHRDSWTGDVSVKERIMIDESEVKHLLRGTYPIQEIKRKMIENKKFTPEQADDWETLATELLQVIQSKQLVPTVRTQCTRTAFQIPFDATVRVSLDTNLCMISERGYDLKDGEQWHRDPNKILLNTEITRFPHAVLEIKLELGGESNEAPDWVKELQNSGLIYEVHKYSKFIHGCSVLLPDYVQSVPYWIDDASIRDTIIASGAGKILADPEDAGGRGPGANRLYPHLLPFGAVAENKLDAVGRVAGQITPYQNRGLDGMNEEKNEELCCTWFCPNLNDQELTVVAPTSVQKVEPKIFFANERTYLHWLHSAATLSTIAAGILAFSSDAEPSMQWVEWYAMALLPLSLGFCYYAMRTYIWRSNRIKTRVPGRWDDPRGPVLLGGALIIILIVNLCVKVHEIVDYYRF